MHLPRTAGAIVYNRSSSWRARAAILNDGKFSGHGRYSTSRHPVGVTPISGCHDKELLQQYIVERDSPSAVLSGLRRSHLESSRLHLF